MNTTEMALGSANEVIGWAREDLAKGKAARAAKRLDTAIEDARGELATKPQHAAAIAAGLALLVAARAEVL